MASSEVRIIVDSTEDVLLPRFETLEEYQQFLIDDALVRYEHLFGQQGWYGGWEDTGMVTPDSSGGGPTPDRTHSETNVQVAGVDEGDIVEFDSDYIYALTGQELVIVDAWPAEELSVASRVEIEGTPLVEFLDGDRLTVVLGYLLKRYVFQQNLANAVHVLKVAFRSPPRPRLKPSGSTYKGLRPAPRNTCFTGPVKSSPNGGFVD